MQHQLCGYSQSEHARDVEQRERKLQVVEDVGQHGCVASAGRRKYEKHVTLISQVMAVWHIGLKSRH
jgi:hypothetical protein